MNPEVSTESESTGQSRELRWQADTPIFSNRSVLLGMLAAVGFSTLFLALLMTAMQANLGRYEDLPAMLGFAAAIGGGVLLLLLLVSLVFFGGKVRMEVVIDEEGVTQTIDSRRATAGSLLAILAGASSGSATTAGAGFSGLASQREHVDFAKLSGVAANPKTHEIRLFNAHRAVMQLYPPEESFEKTLERIRKGIADRSERKEPDDISPFRKFLIVVGSIGFGLFLLADLPLGLGVVVPVSLILGGILLMVVRPNIRPGVGWVYLGLTVGMSVWCWWRESPSLEQAGAGFALGLQLFFLGLFACLGLFSGLRFFNLEEEPS